MQPIQKSYLSPSIAQVFFCAIFLALAFGTGIALLVDGDTGYHIRAGQYIISTLSVPKHDSFSLHTPPLPWTAHEWLSEVVMALVHDRFSLTGIVVFFAGLLAGTVSLLFVTLRADGANTLLAAAVTMLAFCASQIHWLGAPTCFPSCSC